MTKWHVTIDHQRHTPSKPSNVYPKELGQMLFEDRQSIRGGDLKDVLDNKFCSPWPQSLKSSKIALFSARGQHYFLNH